MYLFIIVTSLTKFNKLINNLQRKWNIIIIQWHDWIIIINAKFVNEGVYSISFVNFKTNIQWKWEKKILARKSITFNLFLSASQKLKSVVTLRRKNKFWEMQINERCLLVIRTSRRNRII